MAAKTALSTKNLEALGAKRLAELLIEISAGNAAAKRRLRLELAGATSTGELAKEIRKRLTTIARSRSFVEWQGIKALAHDLDTQRHVIVDNVATSDPKPSSKSSIWGRARNATSGCRAAGRRQRADLLQPAQGGHRN